MSDENYLAQANADYTVKQLIQVALDLEEARMDNRTADLILANESKIAFAVSSLVKQLEDIQRANKNSRAA